MDVETAMKDAINTLKGIDIYLIDQMLKGRLAKTCRILDAGCGLGRNLIPFSYHDYEIYGFDSDIDRIAQLQAKLNDPEIVSVSTIEGFGSNFKFDFIICNAVLHFAKSHAHFNEMFASMASLLGSEGVLFIRMTSDIGQENHTELHDGRFLLPDGTERYLITRHKVDELCSQYKLKLIEPVKNLSVDGLRVMTTLVFAR